MFFLSLPTDPALLLQMCPLRATLHIPLALVSMRLLTRSMMLMLLLLVTVPVVGELMLLPGVGNRCSGGRGHRIRLLGLSRIIKQRAQNLGPLQLG